MKSMITVALSLFSVAIAAQSPSADNAADCAEDGPLVMITDDPYNTAGDLAEKWRSTRLPAPYAQTQRQAARLRCLRLLDPDPLLLALPGATMPDIIVRIRPLRSELYDRTLGDKLDAGVRGYIESYTSWLGAKSTTEGPPLLREAALGVRVLCTHNRRTVREFTATDDEATQPLVQNGENTAMAQNLARVERAALRAATEIESLARDIKSLCAAPATPDARAARPSPPIALPSVQVDTDALSRSPAPAPAAQARSPASAPEARP